MGCQKAFHASMGQAIARKLNNKSDGVLARRRNLAKSVANLLFGDMMESRFICDV